MTHADTSETGKYLLGSVLILALLLGGGTTTGLYTDTIIQLAAFVASAYVLAAPARDGLSSPVAALIVLGAVALYAIQVVPLPSWLLDALQPDAILPMTGEGDPFALRFISIGVGRTLESALFAAAGVAFFLALLRLRIDQLHAMLPFFWVGVVCNGLAAAIQYSLANDVAIVGFFPYTINAGLFANQNHFSTLIFVAIPLIVYMGIFQNRLAISVLFIAACLLLLLAAGSRAGVVIGLVITLMSIVFLAMRSAVGGRLLLALFVLMAVYMLGTWTKISAETIDPEFGRGEFARTTLEGIKANWITGVGFGNFVEGYKIYETPDMIFRTFVNHAHNDYLELVFEGGIVAALLLLAYLAIVAYRVVFVRQTAFQKAASLSLLFVLVHSLVDYPLRTMAITMVFALLNAIMFHPAVDKDEKGKFMSVNHGGKRVRVPIRQD